MAVGRGLALKNMLWKAQRFSSLFVVVVWIVGQTSAHLSTKITEWTSCRSLARQMKTEIHEKASLPGLSQQGASKRLFEGFCWSFFIEKLTVTQLFHISL